MSTPLKERDRMTTPIDRHDDRSPLRNPSLGPNEHIWIALAVLIPVIFTIILCTITVCIYRYRKRRMQQNIRNSSMTPIDQHNTAVATISRDSQSYPIIKEELPPSYELISETKKDLQFTRENNNIDEQFHSSPIQNETN